MNGLSPPNRSPAMRSKPITLLLAVIAALLAANLFVNLSPQVGANPPRTALSGDDDEAVLVGISVFDTGGSGRYVLRLWSDGVVEHRIASNNGNGVGPLNWDPGASQILGWTEIVPLP